MLSIDYNQKFHQLPLLANGIIQNQCYSQKATNKFPHLSRALDLSRRAPLPKPKPKPVGNGTSLTDGQTLLYQAIRRRTKRADRVNNNCTTRKFQRFNLGHKNRTILLYIQMCTVIFVLLLAFAKTPPCHRLLCLG